MEESVTYQAIVRKGRLFEARHMLLRLGRKLFGSADEATEATLAAIDDVEKLEELLNRILDVGSWRELLQPAKKRRRGSRQRGV